MQSDKEIEKKRYDKKALALLNDRKELEASLGSEQIEQYLRSPYLSYEQLIKENISPQNKVLEIGAGDGIHTYNLLMTGAHIVASDISSNSLDIIKKKFSNYSNLETKVADMELLPFDDKSFDFICSAGSLSYGDNQKVMSEIFRVLNNNGVFICVDSLNHNPIYKLNRWINYLKKNRSLSTIKQMPSMSLIKKYEHKFSSTHTTYYGAVSWLAPLLLKIFNKEKTAKLLDLFDNYLSIKKSAFKFVMISKK